MNLDDGTPMRAAAAGLCLLICASATAEPPVKIDAAIRHQADELWKQGKTLYNLGHFPEAVAAWEKAYELVPSETAFLYNLAQAYRKTAQHETRSAPWERYFISSRLKEDS